MNICWEENFAWEFAASELDLGRVLSHPTQPCSAVAVDTQVAPWPSSQLTCAMLEAPVDTFLPARLLPSSTYVSNRPEAVSLPQWLFGSAFYSF